MQVDGVKWYPCIGHFLFSRSDVSATYVNIAKTLESYTIITEGFFSKLSSPL